MNNAARSLQQSGSEYNITCGGSGRQKKDDASAENAAEDTSKKNVNWGTLAYGMLEHGANDFVSSFTSTLDMLAGDFAQEM